MAVNVFWLSSYFRRVGSCLTVPTISGIKIEYLVHSWRETRAGATKRVDGVERLRLRHDYDPAPASDAGRLIIRDRADGEPGLVVILADSDGDYRAYHLGPSELQAVVEAVTSASLDM